MDLLKFTSKGIYCEAGNFYIDPTRPVERAIISHAHSDHAIRGHKTYITHKFSIPILQLRLGKNINVEGIEWGNTLNINGVNVTLYPAGHIIGSSQVKVEYKGEVWVYTGDFKVVDDGISGAFEPVKCNTFITESTFGLPIFKWREQNEIYNDINEWWKLNKEEGKSSIILCYALGKAQRIMQNLDLNNGRIIVHGIIDNTNEAIKEAGVRLPEYGKYDPSITKGELKDSIIIATSAAMNTPWLENFYPYSIAQVSGWMQIRGIRRWSSLDRGFALSDHADWEGLNYAVKETGAENVIVTHGYTSQFAQWLSECGYNAREAGRHSIFNAE